MFSYTIIICRIGKRREILQKFVNLQTMAESNFIDYVRIRCASGRGGAGSAHLRHLKFNYKGGPDGGNGGMGGSVIVRANPQLWTLIHLKYRKNVIAEDGQPGSSNFRTGKSGQDVVLELPLGTVVKRLIPTKIEREAVPVQEKGVVEFWKEKYSELEEEVEYGGEEEFREIVTEYEEEQVVELVEPGQEFVLCKGGRGGLGNTNFKTSTNQTPRYAQSGEDGEEAWFVFELKLLADVGLVGFPNAGKSTLLAAVTSAKPKIADYAFTTLEPNLGIVEYYDNKSFVIADIPGIIEGAHQGKGLGIRFLRHIERNSVLLFMVSVEEDDIKKGYESLLAELREYNPELLTKDRVLAITKCDLIDKDLEAEIKPLLPKDIPHVFISSFSRDGLKELIDMLWKALQA
jgi:GTP-binding protein